MLLDGHVVRAQMDSQPVFSAEFLLVDINLFFVGVIFKRSVSLFGVTCLGGKPRYRRGKGIAVSVGNPQHLISPYHSFTPVLTKR